MGKKTEDSKVQAEAPAPAPRQPGEPSTNKPAPVPLADPVAPENKPE